VIRYLGGRVIQAIFVVLAALTIIFFLMHLTGDPVALLIPVGASESMVVQVRHELGLDQPLYIQYFMFMGNALHGDFGSSVSYNQPALGLVLERLPATLSLAGLAFVFTVTFGFGLGIVAALFRNTVVDTVATGIAVGGQSMPSFWLGTILILLFTVHWQLFPSSGDSGFKSVILPALNLGAFSWGIVARITRSSLLEVLPTDYIRTAKAKGLGYWLIIGKHALRNALLGPITVLGLQASVLFGGAIITEQVFAYPGMARLATQAVMNHDFPIVEAFVFVTALVVLGANLIIDLLYVVIDPRVRLSR
jgi:glutathione transport system permease protein